MGRRKLPPRALQLIARCSSLLHPDFCALALPALPLHDRAEGFCPPPSTAMPRSRACPAVTLAARDGRPRSTSPPRCTPQEPAERSRLYRALGGTAPTPRLLAPAPSAHCSLISSSCRLPAGTRQGWLTTEVTAMYRPQHATPFPAMSEHVNCNRPPWLHVRLGFVSGTPGMTGPVFRTHHGTEVRTVGQDVKVTVTWSAAHGVG